MIKIVIFRPAISIIVIPTVILSILTVIITMFTARPPRPFGASCRFSLVGLGTHLSLCLLSKYSFSIIVISTIARDRNRGYRDNILGCFFRLVLNCLLLGTAHKNCATLVSPIYVTKNCSNIFDLSPIPITYCLLSALLESLSVLSCPVCGISLQR